MYLVVLRVHSYRIKSIWALFCKYDYCPMSRSALFASSRFFKMGMKPLSKGLCFCIKLTRFLFYFKKAFYYWNVVCCTFHHRRRGWSLDFSIFRFFWKCISNIFSLFQIYTYIYMSFLALLIYSGAMWYINGVEILYLMVFALIAID